MMRLILQVWKKTTKRIGARLMWAVSLNVCHRDRRYHHHHHHHHPRRHHPRRHDHHHHDIIIIIIIIIIVVQVIVTLLVQHAHIDSQITEHNSQHIRSI